MFQLIAFSTKRGRSQPGNLEWRLGKLRCAGLTMSNYCAEARGPSSKNLRYFCSRKEGRLEGKSVSYYSETFSGRIHKEVSSFETQWWPSNPWQRTGRQQGTQVSHQTYQTFIPIKLGFEVAYTFQWLMECRPKIRLVSTQKVQSKLTWKQRRTICYYIWYGLLSWYNCWEHLYWLSKLNYCHVRKLGFFCYFDCFCECILLRLDADHFGRLYFCWLVH